MRSSSLVQRTMKDMSFCIHNERSYFFRAFIDEKNDNLEIGIDAMQVVGNSLQQHGFSRTGRGDDESSGSFTNWNYQIKNPDGCRPGGAEIKFLRRIDRKQFDKICSCCKFLRFQIANTNNFVNLSIFDLAFHPGSAHQTIFPDQIFREFIIIKSVIKWDRPQNRLTISGNIQITFINNFLFHAADIFIVRNVSIMLLKRVKKLT